MAKKRKNFRNFVAQNTKSFQDEENFIVNLSIHCNDYVGKILSFRSLTLPTDLFRSLK